MKNIYLIVGKSGSGKSTIVHELCRKYGYKEVQSYTERPKRYEDEIGHIFVTSEEFNQLKNLCAYTVFNGNRYGVPSSMVDECDLYVIDPYGINYMKEHYHGNKNIIVIGIVTDNDPAIDLLNLNQRMLSRGDSQEEVNRRVTNDKIAFKDFESIVNYKIVNNSLENAVEQINQLINNLEREI